MRSREWSVVLTCSQNVELLQEILHLPMSYLDHHGTRLFYERSGQGQPTLVFIHGYCRSHQDWAHQVDHFQLHHVVVTSDLPGHGLSQYVPGQVSIESCGESVAAVVNRLMLSPAVLIGHSMGCRVALQAYLEVPQSVVGLVLIDGSWFSAADLPAARQRMVGELETTGYTGYLRQQFQEMFVAGADPLVTQRIIAEALATPREVGEPLLLRAMEWDAKRMEQALSSVTVPLLVIQSTCLNRDRRRVALKEGETTPWLELVRNRLPRAVIKILPGVGHFSMLETPSVLNGAVEEFVKSLCRPSTFSLGGGVQ